MDALDPALNAYIRSPIAIRRELSSLFKENGPLIIFDIGACEGEDSIRYSKLFPQARIHAFEPVAENAERARNNIRRYGAANITVTEKALSDRPGSRAMFVSSGRPEKSDPDIDYGNKSSSILKPGVATKNHSPWLTFDNERQIECTTIDTYCAEHGIKAIDLVHMDVQGAELLVLQGAKVRLPDIKAIWLEVSDVEFYENQPLAADIGIFMAKNRFRPMAVRHDRKLRYGDRLYANSRFFPAAKIAAYHALDFARRLKGSINSRILR